MAAGDVAEPAACFPPPALGGLAEDATALAALPIELKTSEASAPFDGLAESEAGPGAPGDPGEPLPRGVPPAPPATVEAADDAPDACGAEAAARVADTPAAARVATAPAATPAAIGVDTAWKMWSAPR